MTMSDIKHSSLWPIVFPTLIILLSFSIYLSTVCPTVYEDDSGELISAAYTLGIGHPPGYPLFCILGKIFTVIFPVANIAYRVNLCSVSLALFTILLLYFLLKHILKTIFQNTEDTIIPVISFAASLCFAFSNTFWSQTITSEVYTLNTLFVTAILYLSVKILKSYIANSGPFAGKSSYTHIYLLTFIFGLSLTNHHSMILFAPLFLIVLYIQRFKKNLLKLGLLGILPLSVYLYLSICSYANPPIDWSNPETFSSLLTHVLRKQYGKIGEAIYTPDLWFSQIKSYITSLLSQITPVLFAVSIIGLIYLYLKNKRLLTGTAVMFLLTGIFFVMALNFYPIPEDIDTVKVFFIPSYIIMVIWLAAGLLVLQQFLKRFFAHIYIFFIFLPIIPVFAHIDENDISRHTFIYYYGSNVLATVRPNAMIVPISDSQAFSIAYLTCCEKIRADVKIFDLFSFTFSNTYGTQLRSIINDDARKIVPFYEVMKSLTMKLQIPVYFFETSPPNLSKEVFDIKRNGLIYSVQPKGETVIEPPAWKYYNLDILALKNAHLKDYIARNILAHYYLFLGNTYIEEGDYERGLNLFRQCYKVAYNVYWSYNSIGVIYNIMGMQQESLYAFKKVAELNPYSSIAHSNLSSLYAKLGYTYLAEEEMQKAKKWHDIEKRKKKSD